MAIVRPRRYVTVVNAAAATRADFITAMQASAYYVTSHVYNEETWYIFKVDLTNSTWKTTNSQGRIAELGCSKATFFFDGDAVKVRSLFGTSDLVGTSWDKLFNDTEAPSLSYKSTDCAASYSAPGFGPSYFRLIYRGFPQYFQWVAVCIGANLTDANLLWEMEYHYVETEDAVPLFGTNPQKTHALSFYKDDRTLAGHEPAWQPFAGENLPVRILFPPNYGVGGEVENAPEGGYPVIINTPGDHSQGCDNVGQLANYTSDCGYGWPVEGGDPRHNGGMVNYGGPYAFGKYYHYDGTVNNINANGRDFRAIVISFQMPYEWWGQASPELEDVEAPYVNNISYTPSPYPAPDYTYTYYPQNPWGYLDNHWLPQAIKALIENLLGNDDYNIDPKRVYFTGFSRGGVAMMPILRACRDYIAAAIEADGWTYGTASVYSWYYLFYESCRTSHIAIQKFNSSLLNTTVEPVTLQGFALSVSQMTALLPVGSVVPDEYRTRREDTGAWLLGQAYDARNAVVEESEQRDITYTYNEAWSHSGVCGVSYAETPITSMLATEQVSEIPEDPYPAGTIPKLVSATIVPPTYGTVFRKPEPYEPSRRLVILL